MQGSNTFILSVASALAIKFFLADNSRLEKVPKILFSIILKFKESINHLY